MQWTDEVPTSSIRFCQVQSTSYTDTLPTLKILDQDLTEPSKPELQSHQ